MKRLVLVAALALCSGCSVLIQNRYSVLGIDVGDLDSPAEARFWSLVLLIGVAATSAVLAVLAFWLGQRWLSRSRARAKERLLAASPPPPNRVEEQSQPDAVAGTPEAAFAVKQ